jgi:hypothetical protein
LSAGVERLCVYAAKGKTLRYGEAGLLGISQECIEDLRRLGERWREVRNVYDRLVRAQRALRDALAEDDADAVRALRDRIERIGREGTEKLVVAVRFRDAAARSCPFPVSFPTLTPAGQRDLPAGRPDAFG